MSSNRYDLLREPENTDITGVRYNKEVTLFLHRLSEGVDSTVVVHGYQPCPECRTTLSWWKGKDKWVCTHCFTEYTLQELVEAIEAEDRLMRFLLEDIDSYIEGR